MRVDYLPLSSYCRNPFGCTELLAASLFVFVFRRHHSCTLLLCPGERGCVEGLILLGCRVVFFQSAGKGGKAKRWMSRGMCGYVSRLSEVCRRSSERAPGLANSFLAGHHANIILISLHTGVQLSSHFLLLLLPPPPPPPPEAVPGVSTERAADSRAGGPSWGHTSGAARAPARPLGILAPPS